MKNFGKIEIGNKRKGGVKSKEGFTSIDCDRENPILGNKYVLLDWRDDDMRTDVLFDYKGDYDEDWNNNGPMKQETLKIARRVYKGENVLLNCWCVGAPTFKPCHVEFIKERIEEILKPYRE